MGVLTNVITTVDVILIVAAITTRDDNPNVTEHDAPQEG